MILQFILAMTATAAFAILFCAPKHQLIFSALTGGISWITYLIFCELGFGIVIASLAATFFLTILSRFFAAWRKSPVTLYLVAGIFTLVPGAGIYYTSYYFIMNEMEQCAAKGMETFKIAGAIAIGIIFGFAIPQKLFLSKQK
ncbi:MAG: threonine/serine exporter [Lachnospiraceae bacterium]|nr:threonine/serine exporter [Lachnospiraceae bacterium]